MSINRFKVRLGVLLTAPFFLTGGILSLAVISGGYFSSAKVISVFIFLNVVFFCLGIVAAEVAAEYPWIRWFFLIAMSVCFSGARPSLEEIRESCRSQHAPEIFIQAVNNVSLPLFKTYIFKITVFLVMLLFFSIPLACVLLSQRIPFGGSIQSETQGLEIGSVFGTILLVVLNLMLQPNVVHRNPITAKGAFSMTFLCLLFLLLALEPLFQPPHYAMSDPHESHLLFLLCASVAVCLVDLWALRRTDEPHARRELTDMCLILDLSILASSLMLLSLWLYREKERQTGVAADGIIAGALAMQFVIAACVFSAIKIKALGQVRERQTA